MKAWFSFCLAVLSTLLPCALSAECCGGPVLQVGWFAATQGKSQHVNIDEMIGDDFSGGRSTDQNILVGAGYFFDCLELCQTNIFCGINAFYLAPTKVSGDVIQEDLFTNLSYHYSITNYPIYFATKALVHICSNSDLTIDVGIGPNIISAGGFKERSLDGGITIPDAHLFSRKNVASFSATAGVGWRMNDLFGCLSLELDYRFFYLGEGELKKGNNQLRNTLRTGHGYANALYLSISM